jgi:hypothetical protein
MTAVKAPIATVTVDCEASAWITGVVVHLAGKSSEIADLGISGCSTYNYMLWHGGGCGGGAMGTIEHGSAMLARLATAQRIEIRLPHATARLLLSVKVPLDLLNRQSTRSIGRWCRD